MSGPICRSALVLTTVMAAQLLPRVAGAQDQLEEIKVTARHLSGCVWMLEGRGGNIGVCGGPDGVFMVDDQYAPLTPAIREAVAGISEGPIRFVLNTHWHVDHTGGNENLAGTGAIIVAQDRVRERMATDQFMPFLDRQVPASPPAALPVVTFGEDITFHIDGETIHARHVPAAHTDGDAIVRFADANVVHTGDVVWAGMYPFIDTGSGGSVRGVLDAVDIVVGLADEDTKIIPGHGPLTDLAGVRAYRDMLATIAGRVEDLIGQGLDLPAVVAAKPTAEFDENWGQGFIKPDRFVEMLYEDLAGSGAGGEGG